MTRHVDAGSLPDSAPPGSTGGPARDPQQGPYQGPAAAASGDHDEEDASATKLPADASLRCGCLASSHAPKVCQEMPALASLCLNKKVRHLYWGIGPHALVLWWKIGAGTSLHASNASPTLATSHVHAFGH